jgi:hypothetical protein
MLATYSSFSTGASAALNVWTNTRVLINYMIMAHDQEHNEHPYNDLPSEPALRVKALETILTRKGLIDPSALDKIIDTYQIRLVLAMVRMWLPRRGAIPIFAPHYWMMLTRSWQNLAITDVRANI